jgi:hypothetical protein
VTQLYLAKTADIQPSSGVSSESDVVAVTVRSIFFQEQRSISSSSSGSSSSSRLDVTSIWQSNNCSTTYYSNLQEQDLGLYPCLLSSSENLFTSYNTNNNNNTANICQGIVQSVIYYINHSADAMGSIQSVLADVVLTDISDAFIDTNNLINTTNKRAITLTQQFDIYYSSVDSNDISSTNGNLVKR